jgi:hypothetical protein
MQCIFQAIVIILNFLGHSHEENLTPHIPASYFSLVALCAGIG